MKKHSVFVTESAVIERVFPKIAESVALWGEEDATQLIVQLGESPALPRRWGGYEFPLPLYSLSERELQLNQPALDEALNPEVVEDLAWYIYRDAKGRGIVKVGAVLITRCKKSRGSGLLFYWKR